MKSNVVREMTTEEIQDALLNAREGLAKDEDATCDLSIREPNGSQGKAQRSCAIAY